MSISSVSQASLSYLQYLQKPQANGQPTPAPVQPAADNDGDADDTGGTGGVDTDNDGSRVDIKA
ncbi:MAG: hypothetical protein H6868_04935 [Rhodospirillales bacterium]|nr:hypothetical protein [Rhodospirillales bacterium]